MIKDQVHEERCVQDLERDRCDSQRPAEADHNHVSVREKHDFFFENHSINFQP